MFTAASKIKKDEPDHFESSVAQALYDLQINSDRLKQTLREVQFTSAKELDTAEGKKAVLIFVPIPQLSLYQKMTKELGLIEELEKKFSGKQVMILGERRIIRKESRNTRQLKQKRPFSRSLTAVHEAILDDLVYPNVITGKRTRFASDNSRQLKVSLHKESTDSDKVSLSFLF